MKNIPFVFYTATYTNPKDEELALHLGAARFILKPQEPDEFLRIINGVLSEISDNKISTALQITIAEDVVLKEYNEVLIRKLEHKMLQTEKAEMELRIYASELEKEIIERKKAEESLRESEERFRSLYNEAVIGLYRTNPDGRVLQANSALLKMLGYENVEEIADRNIIECGFEDSTQRSQFLELLKVDGEVKDLESIKFNRDGSKIYIRESLKAVRNASGAIIFFDGIVEDITARKQAESDLQQSRQLFQTLALVSPVGIFKTEPDGYTTYVNPRWTELSGLSLEEALGYGWINAVHPDDRQKLSENWHSDANNKSTSEAEYRFLRKDGRIVWVMGYAVPEIVDGEILGYVGTITDVTELKLTEQKLRTFSRAVEQSPVLILLTDIQGNIQYVNPKFEEVTGYYLDEVIGKNPRILKSGETDASEYARLWDTILRGCTWSGEFQNKKKNGEIYWESAVITPIFDIKGEAIQFLAVKVDITERKESELELRIAKEKAEVMNKLKSNLLSNMSHELRTPLISILGYSEIIQEDGKDKAIVEMARSINNGGNRLLVTLNNLLQFSNIESEKIKPNLENIDVNQLILEILPGFVDAIKQKGLILKTDLHKKPVFGYLDKMLSKEIFANLLQNAIKFTDQGEIQIISKIEKDFICIQFIDTGIGITEEHQKIIFDEFRQASEGLGRTFEGTGLGLTITKKFVNLLGGEVTVQSKPNIGSVFSVRFKNQHLSGLPHHDSDEPPELGDKYPLPTVLYIENDKVSVTVITHFLNDLCIVESAKTGEDALEKIVKNNYDLFLMDINLGWGMNGKQVTQFIRNLPQYKQTPIIAITAYAGHDERDEFLESGCSHYLAKP
ncbi:MAG: PAS domain S-box protein, partial [Ignavibacteriales bacterium]|nr:PAS domain S-box protein [Ignavibacteriales bacterium]